MTKAAELRELSDEEIAEHLEESKKELFNLRFQLATGRLDNVARIQTVRREIARLRTLVSERARATAGTSGEEE
jgi:large subunit ribosomal protein L29